MADSESIGMVALAVKYEEVVQNIDQMFLIVMGILVLFMHAGFAFLETGSVRSKNATSSIFRNILDLFVGGIVYWGTGFAFAYGEPGNPFIGGNHFFSSNVKEGNQTYRMISRYTKHELRATIETVEELLDQDLANLSGHGILSPASYFGFWFFQFVFAISATTIASGALAERVEAGSYLIYCSLMTGFIYPVVSHWTWSKTGWLKSGVGTGLSFQDFAGSAVVHVTGGTAALVGACILGPRAGRFYEDGSIQDFPGHSTPLTTLGGYILFVGFMAFNGGSVLSLRSPESGVVFARAVSNTIIGGSAGALTALLVNRFASYLKGEETHWSLLWTINGALAGMVSMCATCNDLYPWAALSIGAIAGAVLVDWHYLFLYLKVDDPLNAIGIHLGGGLCGIVFGPIFAIQGLEVDGEPVGGVIFGGGTWAWKNWGWNLAGTAAIMVWTAICTGVIFGVMSLLKVFRVRKEVELYGCDKMLHDEPAYSTENRVRGSYSHGQTTRLLNTEGG